MRNLNTISKGALLLALTLLTQCGEQPDMDFQKIRLYGTTASGDSVHEYTLRNSQGMEVTILDYGGVVTTLRVPDWWGQSQDVVLGYDSLDGYLSDNAYLGAIIGRYGNRIGGGRFELDGTMYALATNNGPNHLHGGKRGFDKVVWSADENESREGKSLVLRYASPDGEQGYPGNLSARVEYSLTEENELRIEYQATSDSPTIVNLTNHSYFNLAGAGNGNILDHELMINADRFTPVNEVLIPTGELRPVEGTPMDFLSPSAIGARISLPDQQLNAGGGYDHNWVLNREGDKLMLAARVHEKGSGRVMEVFTTEPGLQFYSGNFLDGSAVGKGGMPYEHRFGFCLETQHFPDSPNQEKFPSTVLRPGEEYRSTTVYKFSSR
ncbi:MAG: aldose epimerase family protein [Bacteroidota bacterium]